MKKILTLLVLAFALNPCNAQFFWSHTKKAETFTPKYGLLYNWYAATDNRNIAADEWRLPSDSDWNTLYSYLASDHGLKVKELGTVYWDTNNGLNTVNFNIRGSGLRDGNSGEFSGLKNIFIAHRDFAGNTVFLLDVSAYFGITGGGFDSKFGFSVRLVRTATTLTHGQTGTYTGNDGKVYRTICIGTQEWLADNLCETKYRNGDPIPEVTDNAAWAALTTGALCAYNNDWSNAY